MSLQPVTVTVAVTVTVTLIVTVTVVETVTVPIFPVSSQKGDTPADLRVKIIKTIKTLVSKELTKFTNSKCDKTQKLKTGQNSQNQIAREKNNSECDNSKTKNFTTQNPKM